MGLPDSEMKTDRALVYAQEGSKEQMGVKILTYYNGQWWNHCTDPCD